MGFGVVAYSGAIAVYRRIPSIYKLVCLYTFSCFYPHLLEASGSEDSVGFSTKPPPVHMKKESIRFMLNLSDTKPLSNVGVQHINPFSPESDQCQYSPAASQEIWHHTVWRTWLFIAYSDEKWLYYKFSLHHSYNRFSKGWENTLFELKSERVKVHIATHESYSRIGRCRGHSSCASSNAKIRNDE